MELSQEPRERANRLLGECQTLHRQGALDDALSRCQQALSICRREGERVGEGAALLNLGAIHRDARRLDDAIDRFDEALRVCGEIGNATGQGIALSELGGIYVDLGHARKGHDKLARALPILREVDHPVAQARALCNLALAYENLGRFEEANETLSDALSLVREVDAESEAATLTTLAALHKHRGRIDEAFEYYETALELWGGDAAGTGRTLNQLAELYGVVGQNEEAIERYLEARDVLRAAEAASLASLGATYLRLDRAHEAVDFYREALQIVREEGHIGGQGTTLAGLAAALIESGRPEGAIGQLFEALGVLREVGDRVGEGVVRRTLGVVCAMIEEHEEALEHLEDALRIFRDLGERRDEVAALAHLGRLHAQLGRASDALGYLEQAIEITESLRGQVAAEELRTSFFGTFGDLYADYVLILVDQGQSERALAAAERGRARAFLDLLAEAHADVREGIDPALREEQHRLLGELSSLRERIGDERSRPDEERDAGRIARLREETRDRTRRLHTLEARIRSTNPRYAALTQLTAWGLDDIRERLLDEDTALLEYVLSARGSLLFCVLEHDFEVFELPPREEIEQQVRELRAAVILGLHAYPHGRALYEALIAPAADLIEGKDLLICADGALHYLPFSLLLTDEPGSGDHPGDGRIEPGSRRSAVANSEQDLTAQVEATLARQPPFDYAALPYLVRKHAISYAPSATVAGLVRADAEARARSYDGDLAGFADPSGLATVADDEAELGAALAHTRDRLKPLPFTAREVWTIAELVSPGELPPDRPDRYDDGSVSVRTAAAATKEEIATLTCRRRFRFFHIASHGLVDAEKPQYSGLVLSHTDGGTRFWRTFEIFNARVPSELVVLSACETGLGKIVSGEGIVGLTRAFLYAGAPTVCVSLWKVADESSPPLMRSFYEAILAGESKGRALQAAQRAMLDEGLYAHPYWWAPFVVVGEARMKGDVK